MSSDDVVIIQDDIQRDSDIEVVDLSKENSTGMTSQNSNNIIDLDDDVVEIVNIDTNTVNKEIKDYLTKVCSENRLIGEFIEKCLDLENSSGMLRAIYRIFLPAYFKMEDSYRESDDFKKLIDTKTRALDVYPNRKFSNLKSVCDIMKTKDKDRKKVEFTTISSEVKAKPAKPPIQRKRRKRRTHVSAVKKSKQKLEHVIVLDDDMGEPSAETHLCESPKENLDLTLGASVDVDDLGERLATVDDVEETGSVPGDLVAVLVEGDNPEMSTKNVAIESLKCNEVLILDDDNDVSNVSNKENNTNRENRANLATNSVPHSPNYAVIGITKEHQIKTLEKQIEYYKKKIDELEQEEVAFDSEYSPYVQCEKMKIQIVAIYKELCKLTGDVPVKKREVRFTATDGYPQLPVKILEKFINDNIGSDGSPSLPDFLDVVKCVTLANETGQFGWQKQRISQEAQALFLFCGQALQQNRKKRDWRYMLGQVNSRLDDDPAEKDAELMERLEVNRRIAVKNESDLLEQFVKMEEGRDDGSISSFRIEQDASDEENESNVTTQTIQPNNKNQDLSNIVNNNSLTSKELVSNCALPNISLPPVNGIVNNQVREMTVRPHGFNSFATRTLEVNSGYNGSLEIRLVSATDTTQILEKPLNAVSSQETHLIEKEDNIQTNKTVANVPNQEHVEKVSKTHTRTEDVEIDLLSGVVIFHESGIISSKRLESYADTYMDFVANNSERVKVPGKSINTPRSRMHSVIKEMNLAAAKQNLTKTSSNGNKDNFSLAPENMPLMIKDVFSVASKHNGTCIANKPPGTDIMNNACENMNLMITDVYSIADKDHDTSIPTHTKNIDDCAATSPLIKEVYSTKPNEISSQVTDNFNHNNKNYSPILHTNTSAVRESNLLVTDNTSDKLPDVLLSHEDVTNQTNVFVETTSTVVDALSVETEQSSSKMADNLDPENISDVENLIKDIKPEVSELVQQMKAFGNSFTATVFDIEDPFLIIEISDTSDESDDDTA